MEQKVCPKNTLSIHVQIIILNLIHTLLKLIIKITVFKVMTRFLIIKKMYLNTISQIIITQIKRIMTISRVKKNYLLNINLIKQMKSIVLNLKIF